LQASDRELSHVLEPSPAPASTAIGNRTVPCPIPLSPDPEASSVLQASDREPSAALPVSRLGKLPGLYERKLRELRKMKNYARKGRTRFDEIYLSVVDRFYDQGRASLNRVRGEAYQRLVEKAYKEKSFNHGNLSHKTIVFGDKGVYIKGFENCGYDIRVTDIVDIIRKRIKKCGWSVDDAASIVSGYDCVAPLSKDELEIIKGMLQFPYRFWEISNRFYNSKRTWTEKSYTPKLAELAESMGQIDRFFERLDNILR
jgi:spore coat protein I